MIDNSTHKLRIFKKHSKDKLLAIIFLLIFLTIFLLRPSASLIKMYYYNYERNLIFGLITASLFGCVFFPKGPVQGKLSIFLNSVSGMALFYLLSLIFMSFHVFS